MIILAKANQRSRKERTDNKNMGIPYCVVSVVYNMKEDGKTLVKNLNIEAAGQVTTGLLEDAGSFLLQAAKSVVVHTGKDINLEVDVEDAESGDEIATH